MYFRFLGLYTEWLATPALVGFSLWLAGRIIGSQDDLIPIYSITMAIWAIFFLEAWKREQVRVASRWGSVGIKQEEKVRPEWEGLHHISQVRVPHWVRMGAGVGTLPVISKM